MLWTFALIGDAQHPEETNVEPGLSNKVSTHPMGLEQPGAWLGPRPLS